MSAKNLQKEFPDLTQSTISDILQTCGNDKKQAQQVLRDMDNSLKTEHEQSIRELTQLFPNLDKKLIKEALENANWDVETAILPLFNKGEELKQEEKKRQDEEARKKRREEDERRKKEETKKQANKLMNIFYNISKSIVQKILDENEGDIEETTNQLLNIVAQQEEEKKKKEDLAKAEEAARIKREQDRLRDLKIQALADKFPHDEVVAALESTEWDIKRALAQLMTQSAEKKKQELKKIFPQLSDDEVTNTLHAHDWDLIKAAEVLNAEKKKQQLLLEQQQQQQQLLKQQQLQSAAVTPIVVPAATTTTTTTTPSNDIVTINKKIQQDILQSSVLLGNKLEDEIKASHQVMVKDQDRAVKALFKGDLEKILATQVRDGLVPGMQPPLLPKQIDAALGKQHRPLPVMEESSSSSSTETSSTTTTTVGADHPHVHDSVNNNNQLPPIASSSPSASSSSSTKSHLETVPLHEKLTVLIAVEPLHPDLNNPITVKWEITSNHVSTPYDWIGFYASEQPNKQYITYQWVGKDKKSGSLTFYAPSTRYGDYEFRYFSNKESYQHVDRSPVIRVGPQMTLNTVLDIKTGKITCQYERVSGNEYSRSWIGLFEKSQTDNKHYLAWEHAVGAKGSVVFDAPVKPTLYECRFFTNSYLDMGRSNAVKVEGEDAMHAIYDPEKGTITIQLKIVSVDPYYNSAWIGLYFTSEVENRQWRRYKYVSDRAADIVFKAPKTAGEYEARLFANKTYDLLLKSNKFTIGEQKH